MKLTATAVLFLALTACGGTEPTTEPEAAPPASASSADAVAAVAERFGACITAVGGDPATAAQEGEQVVVPAGATVLRWDVGAGNTGDLLTIPTAETQALFDETAPDC